MTIQISGELMQWVLIVILSGVAGLCLKAVRSSNSRELKRKQDLEERLSTMKADIQAAIRKSVDALSFVQQSAADIEAGIDERFKVSDDYIRGVVDTQAGVIGGIERLTHSVVLIAKELNVPIDETAASESGP